MTGFSIAFPLDVNNTRLYGDAVQQDPTSEAISARFDTPSQE